MPRSKKKAARGKTWKKVHNEELASLFRKGPYRGGITTNDMSPSYIDAVREEHFPWYDSGDNYMENF